MEPLPPYSGFPPLPNEISVTEPVSEAIQITKRLLFPIDLGKWLTLGFVAWLATLGEGGGGTFNLPDTGSGPGGGGPGIKPAVDWVLDNVSLVVAGTLAVLLVGVAIGAAITWVSSRAKLMFVHCLVHDEAKVEEPWRRYAARGKDLFWVRLYLGLAELVVLLLGVGVGLALAFPELETGVVGSTTLVGLAVTVSIIVLGSAPLGIAGALLEDFVVPAMYLHDEPVRPAWQRVRAEIIAGNVGRIVLFYLMKLVLGIAVGVIATAATCITCCVAGLPYIGTVILLPLFVFARCYSLCFVQQFGPEWRLFPRPEPPLGMGFSGP